MKGPTMRRLTWGSARQTAKWPTSTLRGTTISSIASAARVSPAAGSLPGQKLMPVTPYRIALAGEASSHVERFGSGRLARRVECDLLHARFGLAQQLLAAPLERLASLIDGDRLFERDLAFFEPLDDRFKLLDSPLERQARDVGVGLVGHGDGVR